MALAATAAAWNVAVTLALDPLTMWGLLLGLLVVLVVALGFVGVLGARVGRKTEQLRQQNEALQQEIEARERAEQQLVEAQKMEAVGHLAAGLAHDFNNLLTVLHAHADGLIDADDPSTQKSGYSIRKAVKRASKLTRQLLAFARKQTLRPRLLEPNVLLDEVAPLLRRGLREDIQLTLDLDSDVPRIEADQGQLEQVLLNLAMNARDALPRGGRVTISTRVHHVEKADAVLRAGAYVEVRVRDNGVGMDEGTLARVFDPFFSTKHPRGGTGLGLAVAYGIVRQSGGDLRVQAAVGEGATFTILLPAAPAASKFASNSDSSLDFVPDRDPSRKTVLLVEDEEEVRETLAFALTRAGYHVLVAEDAGQAVLLARDNPLIHLMITDVIMPGMRGPELVRRLRDTGFTAPVLVISGYAGSEVEDLEPGSTLLHKPFSSRRLLARTRELVG